MNSSPIQCSKPVTGRILRQFLPDQKGAIAITALIFVMSMIAMTGLGVDTSRTYNLRNALNDSVDSAALAVASRLATSNLSDAEIQSTAMQFIRQNIEGAGFSEKVLHNVNIKVDRQNGAINVNAGAKADTLVMHLFTDTNINVLSNSKVDYPTGNLEVAIAMDFSSSMRPHVKTAKLAANALVEILLSSSRQIGARKARVALIPYSGGVNPGAYKTRVANKASERCLTIRKENRFSDAPPAMATGRSPNRPADPKLFFSGTKKCPDTAIIPLTARKSTLTTAIRGLKSSAHTATEIGLLWSLYTLSPNWGTLWPHQSRPASHSNPDNRKFIVIMTDGRPIQTYNVEAFLDSTVSDPNSLLSVLANVSTNYRANLQIDKSQAHNRALQACRIIKNSGIKIYSVYFETGSKGAGRDLMEQCATNSETFFLAENQSVLVQSFETIGKEIRKTYIAL